MSDRRSFVRWCGVVILAAGAIWCGGMPLPMHSVPSTQTLHEPHADRDCEAFLAERETTRFRVPEPDVTRRHRFGRADGDTTVAEVARKFALDLREICRLNETMPPACGSQVLSPGEEILLPLSQSRPRPLTRTPGG